MARLSCDELADLVVEALKALRPGGDTTTVEAYYLQRLLDPDYVATITGRKLFVVPLGKSQAETASRGDDTWQSDIRVIVVERYTDAAGDVPKAWTKLRTKWVEDNVLHVLGDARNEDFPQVLRDLDVYPESAEVAEFFDDDLLRRMKLFFSAVDFGFRRDE